jgi:hypothetical protein
MTIPTELLPFVITGAEYLAAAKVAEPEPVKGFTAKQQGLPTKQDSQEMQEIFANACNVHTKAGDPELSIPNTHMLPTRAVISIQPGVARICSDELIRIQSTGEYPTLEEHLAGTSPAAEPTKPKAVALMAFVDELRRT